MTHAMPRWRPMMSHWPARLPRGKLVTHLVSRDSLRESMLRRAH
jgi:hypothetical protein